MRLPPGLCPGPRYGGGLQHPGPHQGDVGHTLAKNPTSLRDPLPRDPTIHLCLEVSKLTTELVAVSTKIRNILYNINNRTVTPAHKTIKQFPNHRLAALNVKKCA